MSADWHFSDMTLSPADVRLLGYSGHRSGPVRSPLLTTQFGLRSTEPRLLASRRVTSIRGRPIIVCHQIICPIARWRGPC